MKKVHSYPIVMIESDEGFAVSCPALKGCHSQGRTRREALAHIKIAIREWLEAERAENAVRSVVEAEVTV